MSDQPSLIQIGKALSDELRVKILTELSTKPPMRHTDLLKSIGLDGAESNKLTYHLNILLDAGLIIKLDHHYKSTERGIEIYKSLSITIEDWEELAYSDQLKTLTGIEATSLLCSEPLRGSGYMYASIGVLLYLFLRNTSYLILLVVGLLALGSSYIYKPPKTDFEDNIKVQKHITRLLGENRLMPILIFETLNISSGLLMLIILLLDLEFIQIGFQVYAMIGIILINVWLFIWLIRSMQRAWDIIQQDKKPVDYQQSLLIIASIFIQFYLFSGFYLVWSIISETTITNGMIWVVIPISKSILRIFKETYTE